MDSHPTSAPRLVVIEGKDKGKVITLKEGTVIIGRSKGDILIHDSRISRSHIALNYNEQTQILSFTDLKSLNGTLYNGEAKEQGELHDGDRLQLGNTVFDCQLENDNREKTVKATHISFTNEPKVFEEAPVEEPVVLTPPNFKERFATLSKRTKLMIAGLGSLGLLLLLSRGGSESPSPDLKGELGSLRTLSSQGKFEEALTRAEDLSKKYPEHSDTYMMLGDLYAKQSKIENAIRSYRRAHELPPPQPMAHVRLVRLFIQAGMFSEAEQELKHLDEVLRKDGPHSKDLFIESAQLFIDFRELKQPPEKIFILAKALQTTLAPESSIGYKLEAQALFLQNRPEEAVTALVKAKAMNPTDEWIQENLAYAQLSNSDSKGATQTIQDWVNQSGSSKAQLMLAYLKFNAGDMNGSKDVLEKLITTLSKTPTNPRFPESLTLLGQVFLRLNDNAQAGNYFKQACSLGSEQACASVQNLAPRQNSSTTK